MKTLELMLSTVKSKGLWRNASREQSLLDMIRNRVFFVNMGFIVCFMIIALRLVGVMVLHGVPERSNKNSEPIFCRRDIIDRNGTILATNLVTGSIYANPQQILNLEEAAKKILMVLPELKYKSLIAKLKSERKFVWVARHVSPKVQHAIYQLGVPGLYVRKDIRRVHPYSSLTAHLIGHTDLDGRGLAGIERYFDDRLSTEGEPLKLALDIRAQYIVRDELAKALKKFSAKSGNAMVIDMKTGEMITMVSLPDYDPNLPAQGAKDAHFNRNTLGLYESGSTFKVYNTAIALETGYATLKSRYDARAPIRIGRFTITDFKGQNRVLTLEEAFLYSSNIANAKIALGFGAELQRKFLDQFGLFKRPPIELSEVSSPLIPRTWKDATTITVAYGYGIAVSPLQVLLSIGSIINDGNQLQATLLYQDKPLAGMPRIVSSSTSKQIRYLMRLAVTQGTAKLANVEGHGVIGKTGSAHILKSGGRYADKAKRTTFVGAFPQQPRYAILVMLEEPQAIPSTHGYSTGGWNAAPTAGQIIARISPLLCTTPLAQEEEDIAAIIPVSHLNSHVP